MMSKRAELELLLDAISVYFHHATPGLGAHVELYQNAEWGFRQRDKALRGMHYFDGILRTQPFVTGESFSMADITVIGGLIFAGLVELPVPAECKALNAWYAKRQGVQKLRCLRSSQGATAPIGAHGAHGSHGSDGRHMPVFVVASGGPGCKFAQKFGPELRILVVDASTRRSFGIDRTASRDRHATLDCHNSDEGSLPVDQAVAELDDERVRGITIVSVTVHRALHQPTRIDGDPLELNVIGPSQCSPECTVDAKRDVLRALARPRRSSSVSQVTMKPCSSE